MNKWIEINKRHVVLTTVKIFLSFIFIITLTHWKSKEQRQTVVVYFITFCGESRTASHSLPALKRKKERDERIGSSREGGKRVERSRGSSISGEIQQRRKLLSELRQRPYHTPLESSPWHPHQDLQIPCPWSPRCPRHPVPSLSLSKPIVNSIPNYYFFTLIFFLGIIRSCVHVVEIDKSFTGMYQQVVLFVNFVAMMARFVFFFF